MLNRLGGISHSGAVPLHVVADTQERPSGVPQLLGELGVVVETRRLWAGDYLVCGRALVERKTVRGLHAAIIDGTFWPQVGRLRDGSQFAYLLLEGKDIDDGPLAEAAIRGICIALMDLGVAIIRSTDANDSALWLQRLAVRRAEVRHRNVPPYAQRPKQARGAPAAEAALAAVPGISRVYAQRLLRHFGTLAAVVQAEPSKWQAIPGIGPTRANAMAETFQTPPIASRSLRDRRDPST